MLSQSKIGAFGGWWQGVSREIILMIRMSWGAKVLTHEVHTATGADCTAEWNASRFVSVCVWEDIHHTWSIVSFVSLRAFDMP